MPLMLFYVFATILVAGALGVIGSRNPVYSVLCLVVCFFCSSVIWLLVEAEFLALVLALVYVGAVMVLFMFIVMMLDIDLEELRRGYTRFAWLGWITAGAVVLEVAGVVLSHRLGLDATRGMAPLPPGYSNTRELGALLYSRYNYPFEIAGMLLLVAIVAAIALTLRHRPGLKKQDIGAQVGARASERVRIVKMRPEPRR